MGQISVFASTTNKTIIQEYYGKRFVWMNNDGANYRVDLKDVTGIFHDVYGHFSEKYSSKGDMAWKGAYIILLKNGHMFITGANADPQGKLSAFHTCLSDHPEFINML